MNGLYKVESTILCKFICLSMYINEHANSLLKKVYIDIILLMAIFNLYLNIAIGYRKEERLIKDIENL